MIQTILRQFFFRNAVESKPVLTRVLNPKECGVQERSPGKGCVEQSHPHKKKKFDRSLFEKFPNIKKKKSKKKILKLSETYAIFFF